MRILLVEDNPDHASLIQRCLQRGTRDHQVDCATDGQQALDHLSRCLEGKTMHLPDLILLDLNLPRVGGHEVLATVKRTTDLKCIPVVVLTTSDSDTDRTTAYSLHANSYLIKSPEYRVLYEMLDDVQRYWSKWDCYSSPSGQSGPSGTPPQSGAPTRRS
ncbi:response regulator [Engelhardtia mirabilis]|uniref:Response regulator rcp1 n=1 Tax=Engelhardtia mirabilis TaxID=2528011 RepID=A0A518BQY1_9BACT|nr:Response regulator rcp1 [Planctomycetes bacterium Pla133]QDV03701.1 Response regulator rcp1 [Planctomycetes bacterium Pla86]